METVGIRELKANLSHYLKSKVGRENNYHRQKKGSSRHFTQR